jgi:guanylate kinase
MSHKPAFGIVISGPSGVGKGTVIQAVLKARPDLALSISFSTRKQRDNETEGVDYYFTSLKNFKTMVAQDQFIEWAEVHENCYGTPVSVMDRINTGQKVVFEVDVQGAKSLISLFNNRKNQLLSIFLAPPSQEVLSNRLVGRGTESTDSMAIRLKNATKEMADSASFNEVVINDRIDETVQQVLRLIEKKERTMQQTKYDKFLFTYAVAKRAKSILEEGIVYEPEATREEHPILEAIKEINDGLVEVKLSELKAPDIKEEEDTLDSLYENIKIADQDMDMKPKGSVMADEVFAAEALADAAALAVDSEDDDEDDESEDDPFVDDEDEVMVVGDNLEGDLAAGGMHTEDADLSSPPDLI